VAVGTHHVHEMSLRPQALVCTAETNSEDLRHMSQRGKCFLHSAFRELYFVLLTPESAPIVTVTWLRVREVTSSILGSELVNVHEDSVCIYVLFDIVNQY
jgi:hypothetical protein